jgi:hypothetical protein
MENPFLAETAGMLIRNFYAPEFKPVFSLNPHVVAAFVRRYLAWHR